MPIPMCDLLWLWDEVRYLQNRILFYHCWQSVTHFINRWIHSLQNQSQKRGKKYNYYNNFKKTNRKIKV